MTMELYDWQRLLGEVKESATFRQELSDFQVTEELRFEPSGEGAHHLLYIEKRNINTDIVCDKLRRFADVKPLDIGYAGKKDRFAIASQWFSVQLPMLREIEWSEFNDENIKVLSVTRHDKKLRIGAVKQNSFKITLRDFKGDQKLIATKLEKIRQQGFANYFGEQRFGRDGANLAKAENVLATKKRLKNRNLQGLLFSSARSFMFNHVVSERIKADLFSSLMAGEFVQLDGSEKGFRVEDLAAETNRYLEKDLHPTAPLPGRGRETAAEQALAFENYVLEEYQELIQQLANKGLNSERRAIRVFPKNLEHLWHDEQTLELNFSLPKGSYATSLLRELLVFNQPEALKSL